MHQADWYEEEEGRYEEGCPIGMRLAITRARENWSSSHVFTDDAYTCNRGSGIDGHFESPKSYFSWIRASVRKREMSTSFISVICHLPEHVLAHETLVASLR